MNNAPNPTPAGWFPDPLGRHEHRYFNGRNWTVDVADGGQRRVDPFGSTPGPGMQTPSGAGQFPSTGSGGSTAAMVCGIIAVVIAWMPFLVVGGVVLAVLALVFGIRGVRRSETGAAGRGRAITGIVTGAVAVGLSIIGIWLSVITVREVKDFIEPASHAVTVTDCSVNRSVVTVTGTIDNLSDETAQFTIFVEATIELTDPSTTSRRPRILIPIEVAPTGAGDTSTWQAIGSSAVAAESCTATADVYGPYPFGVEVDRP